MLFVYPALTDGAYWMKNTLIPLSIAFYDEDGQILRILEMEPCRADPWPLYDPGLSYAGALVVNQGAFARWGVREGDRSDGVERRDPAERRGRRKGRSLANDRLPWDCGSAARPRR